MKTYTKIMCIIYLVFSILLSITWMLACIMPVAMSFDAGVYWKTILMDIALVLGPVLIMALSNFFMWRHYRKERYKISWYIMVVMVVLIALLVIRLQL